MAGIISELIQKSKRPLVMGILNATLDSFSGDGTTDEHRLIDKALEMIDAGADIIDIGGESSRPFAQSVPPEVERARVLPVIKKLSRMTSTPISIDTYHPDTAQASIDEGAVIVNDITGLTSHQMLDLVMRHKTDIIIMHMKGTPADMQNNPVYNDVIGEIKAFLFNRTMAALQAGIPADRIIVDPGIGFGKTLMHNTTIFQNLKSVKSLGFPVLLGASRKSFIGQILDVPVSERLSGSLAAVAVGFDHGVDIFRVHDVQETVRFLTVLTHLKASQSHPFSIKSQNNE